MDVHRECVWCEMYIVVSSALSGLVLKLLQRRMGCSSLRTDCTTALHQRYLASHTGGALHATLMMQELHAQACLVHSRFCLTDLVNIQRSKKYILDCSKLEGSVEVIGDRTIIS
eukprot:629591-Amphidinium_carterae.1